MMLTRSYSDFLKWTLLGTLGASVATYGCGGTAESTTGGDGDGDGDGDVVPGDGDGDVVVGDGDVIIGDGDVIVGDGDGDGDGMLPACTNPQAVGKGFESCDEGYTHRPRAVACDSELPRTAPIGNPDVCSAEQGCCIYDSDCVGERAYCQVYNGEVFGSYCATGCIQDSDCGAGSICECGSPIGRCVTAECTSDADCSGEARCSNWARDTGCGAEVTYSCQTNQDECASAQDCSNGDECVPDEMGVRRCQPMEFSCAVGRPFLIQGEARLAPLVSRGDWSSDTAAWLDDLNDALRAELASVWEAAGQMEHASIAAFARFQLELLALGAPADLIEKTNQALVDETRHARICFGLASRYRGREVGPGPLDVNRALEGTSLHEVVLTTILEGCIGETVAALEAAEAAAYCEDEVVKHVLTQIRDDESRHAALAWRFVQWALQQDPSLESTIRAQFPHVSGQVSNSVGKEPGPLAHLGVLSKERRVALRAEALQQVIVPCADQLFRVSRVAGSCRPEPGQALAQGMPS